MGIDFGTDLCAVNAGQREADDDQQHDKGADSI